MANLSDFQKPDRRPCYVMRIAGLDVIYGTHLPFNPSEFNGAGQETMHRRAAISPSSISFSRRYDENVRIVQVENLRVSLASQATTTGDTKDPARVFSRTGYRQSDYFARVMLTVSQLGSSVQLDDASNFSVGDIIHINTETLKITQIGDGGDPNRLVCTRGMYGTIAMRHQVDADSGSYPYATKPLTYFRGRRVTIYEGIVDENGAVSSNESDYIEVYKGFIATEPEVANDGRLHTVEIEISPLTAIFDKPLPVSKKTANMHPKLHAFDGLHANKLYFCAYIDRGWIVDQVGLIDTFHVSNSGQYASSYDITGLTQTIKNIRTVFDNEIADYHPRSFTMRGPPGPVSQARLFSKENPSSSDTSLDGADFYMFPFANATNFDQANSILDGFPFRVQNDPAFDVRVVRMDGGSQPTLQSTPLVRDWHKLIRLRVTQELGATSKIGQNGYWFNVRYEPSLEVFRAFANCSGTDGAVFKFGLAASNSGVRLSNFIKGIDPTYRAIEFFKRSSNASAFTGFEAEMIDHGFNAVVDVTEFERFEVEGIPSEAINLDSDDSCLNVVLETRGEQNQGTMGEMFAPLATAFYSLGVTDEWQGEPQMARGFEKFICLDDNSLSDSTVTVRKGDELIAILKLGVANTTGDIDGESGYYYEVKSVQKFQDVKTIADYPGDERHNFVATISPANDFEIGDLFLSLLQSTDGNLIAGSYDTMPFGAGLLGERTPAQSDMGYEIDEGSFLRIQNPLGTLAFAPDFFEGDTLGDLLSGLLNASGYTVDMRTKSSGICVLQAVEIGLPDVSAVKKTFDETIIADSPPPSSISEISIKNVFKFSSNYDLEGEPQLQQTIKDQVSIDLFNEARDLSIELKGIRLPIDSPGDFVAALRPVFSKLRIENSYPRRVYTLEVPTGHLHGLALGDTCKITHSLIQGLGGIGITNEPARIRSISFDGYSATGTIELVSYGVAGAGWNHAFLIESMDGTSTTTVIIDHSELVPRNLLVLGINGRTPVTQQIYATNFFEVGQIVEIIPLRGQGESAPYERTITNIEVLATQIKVTFNATVDNIDDDGFGALAIAQVRSRSSGTDNDFAYVGNTVTT